MAHLFLTVAFVVTSTITIAAWGLAFVIQAGFNPFA